LTSKQALFKPKIPTQNNTPNSALIFTPKKNLNTQQLFGVFKNNMNTLISSLNGLTQAYNDTILIIFLSVFCVLVTLFAVWMIATNINAKPTQLPLATSESGAKQKGKGTAVAPSSDAQTASQPPQIASNKPQSQFKAAHIILFLSVIGLAIRIAFSFATNGFLSQDTTNLSPTINIGGANGLMAFYTAMRHLFENGTIGPIGVGENIYPIPYFLMVIFGGIASLFGPINTADPTLMTQFLFRLPFAAFDIATAILLYKIAKKHANEKVGIALAAICLLNPIFIFTSSIWGSVFSILAFFVVLTLYFMVERKFILMFAALGLAILTHRDALLFSPIILVFAGYHYIRAIKLLRHGRNQPRSAALQKSKNKHTKNVKIKASTVDVSKDYTLQDDGQELSKIQSIKQLFLDKERGLVLRMPLYLIGGLIAMYIVNLPLLGLINFNFFTWFNNLFVFPLASGLSHFGFNALSIFNLFGRNNGEMLPNFNPVVFSIMFFVIALAVILLIYTSRKNRANLTLLAAYILLVLSIFFMNFTELNLVVALAVLLLAFVFVKDKRILHIFGALSLVVLINAGVVMASAGFFSNAALTEYSLSTYTGTAKMIDCPTGSVVNYICTALTLLIFLYATIIVLDISLSNQRKLFSTKKTTFFAVMKDWFKIKK